MKKSLIDSKYLEAAKRAWSRLTVKFVTKYGDDWQPGPGDELIENLQSFLKTNCSKLGANQFALKLRPDSQEVGEPLTPKLIGDLCNREDGLLLIDVNKDLQAFSTTTEVIEEHTGKQEHAAEHSMDCPTFLYINSKTVCVYAKGVFVLEFDPVTGSRSGEHSKFNRSCKDYVDMIIDHYDESVKHADYCDHWETPKDRKLRRRLGKYSKTEEIFQYSLLAWLNSLTDGHAAPEPTKPNNDRADIGVYGLTEWYLIEIKWLGTNGKTTYKIDRVTKALKQSGAYSDRKPKPKRVTLVAYDGRIRSDFDALKDGNHIKDGVFELNSSQGTCVPANGDCYVLFLEHERASELS